MRRVLTSARAKTGLALLGGSALAATGWAYYTQDPSSEPMSASWRPQGLSNFLNRRFVSADTMTHSVLDRKFERPTIPWDINWDKYDFVCIL